VPSCLELPRLIPTAKRRLRDPKKARRLLDGDDVGFRAVLAGRHDTKPTNLDQGRQGGVASRDPTAPADERPRTPERMKLEQLTKGARVRGLAVEGIATVKSVEFHGSNAMEIIFTDAKGALHNRILTRDDEPSLEPVEVTRPWSFDADGNMFRLVSEARRIQLAWLFDPYVAITSSTIEPLPHQISGVYEEMLPSSSRS
jgi:hypothetical protein